MNAPEKVLPDDPAETDKTGETDLVGNDEFLRTLFDGLAADVAPVVASFVGNPHNVTSAAWKSRRWQHGDSALPADTSNAHAHVSAQSTRLS